MLRYVISEVRDQVKRTLVNPRRRRVLLVAPLIAIALFVGSSLVPSSAPVGDGIGPQQAKAGASTCAQFGYGIKIGRNGYFCSTIAGTSTFVSYVSGYFGWVVPYLQRICYPSMKVDFYDSNGWYSWKPGGQLSGCYGANLSWSLPTIWVNAYKRPGWARVSLLSAGSTVAEIWFQIKA